MIESLPAKQIGKVGRLVRRVVARGNIGAIIGLATLILLFLAAFLLPLPYDPIAPDVRAILLPPNQAHWFGTDVNGFDIYSRVIASGAVDLPLAIAGTLASLAVGVPLGLWASSKGPWGERIMRGLDAFQAFPLLVLAIAVVTLLGNRIGSVIVAIVMINGPRFMRLVRSEVLSMRESRFVEAAIASGATNTRVLWRHILPNVKGVILAQATLAAAHSIIVIAALGFLGVGVRPPQPSWGIMIQSGARHMATGQWWTVLFPGLAVFVSVLSLNIITDRLQTPSGGLHPRRIDDRSARNA